MILTLLLKKIPNPGDPKFLNLPEKLKNILRLDKPDLIISKKMKILRDRYYVLK